MTSQDKWFTEQRRVLFDLDLYEVSSQFDYILPLKAFIQFK